jgi:hypothetical protein
MPNQESLIGTIFAVKQQGEFGFLGNEVARVGAEGGQYDYEISGDHNDRGRTAVA